MKTIILEEPGRFSIEHAQEPQTVPIDSALVRVLAIGICGTDLHAYEGKQPFFSYPRILGHELAVEILETNGETKLKKGDVCAVRPYMNCGKCAACRRGINNACENLQVLGVHYDGGMQEVISIPLSHLHLAPDVPVDHLALVEMFSIGAHAVRRANLNKGDNVLVIGAGPIGMATAQFARIAGMNVAIMDINPKRLAFCRDTMRFENVIAADQAAAENLREAFGGDLPIAVFDATGSGKSMHQAFNYVAHGGKLVFVGLFKGEITFDDPFFHSREMTLIASRNATASDFDWVIESLGNGQLIVDGWITHRVTAEELIDSFPTWLEPETGVIKALLRF